MKTVLKTSLLAATLLAALPPATTAAADQPPAAAAAPAPARAPGPVADAMLSAARELQTAANAGQPLSAQLDAMGAIRYTPETAAKLRAVFGHEQPFKVERQSARPGHLQYQLRLQPLHYTGKDDSRVDWDEALVDFDMDQASKTVDFSGRWNTVSASDATSRLSAENITLSGHQRRSPDKLWFGNGELRIGQVRGSAPQGPGTGMELSMRDLRTEWRSTERAKTVDMQFQHRIGSIEAAGEKVEDLRFDFRLVNVDRASLVALQAASERKAEQAKTKAMTPEQEWAALKPLLQGFGRSAMVRGSAIEIDEISARYHGNKASIRGRLGLAGAVEADLKDIVKLVKKIDARFEIRVPVAMVRDISSAIAARQSQQQGTQPNGASVAQMAQTMTDVVVGRLLGAGYARIENDVLVSDLAFRNGKLTANGKEVVLPKTPAGGKAPAAAKRSDLPANALQARRIPDSCRLPDFPDEVIAQDKTLAASFAYRVNEAGKVENTRVTRSSGYAGWDQAVIEALGQCRYIPALQNGKPIGLNIDWNVVRTAGGPRSPEPTP